MVQGTENMKIDAVQKHEISKLHTESRKLNTPSLTSEAASKTQAGKALLQLEQGQMNELRIKFRNAHAVAKADKSLKDYVWLCDLDWTKGLNPGESYVNDKAARSFIQNIANTQRKTRTVRLADTKYLSFTIDGRRGHMTAATLNDLMLIHCESPDIRSFNPDAAIETWLSSTPSGQRRRLRYFRNPVSKEEEEPVATACDIPSPELPSTSGAVPHNDDDEVFDDPDPEEWESDVDEDIEENTKALLSYIQEYKDNN